MAYCTLVVPGYLGSGPGHWQSWLEREVPGARRVGGIDWNTPCLDRWAEAIGDTIRREAKPVWIVAHSFGCLASLVAVEALTDRVAGLMLVAPADPQRFDAHGLRDPDSDTPTLLARLDAVRPALPGLVVASTDDPWMNFATAAYWAGRWGLPLHNAGAAGHINVEAGYGPWPAGRALLARLQASDPALLLGALDEAPASQ